MTADSVVAMTELVDPLMTDTVLERGLATYILSLEGSYAIPNGNIPTGIVAV
ncbi:MAG: hypothetical protein ACJ71R_14560 [Nitrososphaeraceae archaeon]